MARSTFGWTAASSWPNATNPPVKRAWTCNTEGGDKTDVEIRTDANVMGKLGEFGQAVIRKKADQIVQEFANNLSAAVAAAA